jgi:hypothetical protein
MRQTALVLVNACLLALLPACGLHRFSGLEPQEKSGEGAPVRAPKGFRAELHPGTWALERISRDGTVIWIRTEESTCLEFHHAKLRKVKGGLRVTAIDRVLIPKRGYGCTLPLFARRHRVELPRPLGDDRIVGACVPGEATPDQRVCALLHQAAGR